MGCNYYLEHKNGDYWDLPKSDKLGEKVNRLVVSAKNYGWRTQTLYIDDLTEKTYKLHIGKKSAGWRFSLCMYPFLNIYTLDDWKIKLNEKDSYIVVDEYGDEVSVEDLLKEIEDKDETLLAHTTSFYDTRNKSGFDDFLPIISTYINTSDGYDLTPDWDFS